MNSSHPNHKMLSQDEEIVYAEPIKKIKNPNFEKYFNYINIFNLKILN